MSRIPEGEVPVPVRWGFARWSNGQYSAPMWFYKTMVVILLPMAAFEIWRCFQ